MRVRRALLRTTLFFACWHSSTAIAQTPPIGNPPSAPTPEQLNEAAEHFHRGVAFLDRHNNDAALAEFQRAWQLSGRASALRNIAVALHELHRYPEELRILERYLTLPELRRSERADAERASAQLRALLAHLHVTVTPDDATVTLDGHPLTERVERSYVAEIGPGEHTLLAHREGYFDERETFMVASGDTHRAQLTLRERPRDPTPPNNPPPTVLRGRLLIAGLPVNSQLMIDGSARAPSPEALPLPVGSHDVAAQAPGMHPWRGAVEVHAEQTSLLRVSLASRGLPPALFWSLTITSGALAIGGFSLWGAGVAENGWLANAPPEMRLPAGAPFDRGVILGAIGDGLLVSTLATGLSALVVGLRTEFSPRQSSAHWTFAVRQTPTFTLQF